MTRPKKFVELIPDLAVLNGLPLIWDNELMCWMKILVCDLLCLQDDYVMIEELEMIPSDEGVMQ